MAKDDLLLTVREVAMALRVDETTVRRWIKQGLLEAVSLPHGGTRQGYRIKSRTIDQLMNGKQDGAQPQKGERL